MANKNFYVHNGLTVGGLTIDAGTSTLVTSGIIITTSTTAATTVTSGALQVRGGAGVVGDLYVGGNIYDGGYLVLNTNNLATYAITAATGGTDTSVSITGGNLTIWNTSTLQTITNRGATTTNAIHITNATQATNSTTGALRITGGIGIGGNAMVGGDLEVWGDTTFAGPVTFNGTATYVYSANSFYTDNMLHLHESTSTTTEVPWTFDDGKDVGLKLHYYNRALNTGTAGGLILANDTQYLEWYDVGTEGSSSTFVGTSYGTFKTGRIILTSTATSNSSSTGALQIAGGIGVGGNSFIGGNLTVAGTINAQISGLISTATNLANGAAGQVPYQVSPGITGFYGPGTAGQLLVSNGTSAPTYTNTSSIYVGSAGAIAVQTFSANSNHFLAMFNTSTVGVLTPGIDTALYFNPSNNTLFSGTFNGAHVGNGSGLTNIPNSALDNSTITINTGAGISVSGSPVSLGGVFTITNTGVTQFLGGTTGLTSTNQTGVVTLTGTLGTANGGTNNTVIGNAGTVAYSDGSKYAFLNSGTVGSFLTQGTNSLVWSSPTALSVGTATNLSGITPGAIPIGSATNGVVSYINTGAVGTVLTMAAGNTATWQALGGLTAGSATTASNIAGGSLGAIPYQTAPGLTSFIGTGTTGSLLQMGANTATFVAAGAVTVGASTTATNLAGGVAGRIPIQSSAGITSFINSGTVGQVLLQGTNTATFVDQSTLSVGTATNVAGGNAGLIVLQTGAGRTGFIGSGTNGQILVQGTNTATWTSTSSIYVNRATLADSATLATDVSGGIAGQLLYQSAPNATDYVGPGTAGQILQSAGSSSPTYVNQSTLSVGTATNLASGAAGSIPIQTGAGATSFIPIGTVGYVLTAAAGNTATWQALSGLTAGSATTASNIAGGTAGQVPYQTAAGATSFYGPGTAGQVLVSGGTGAPVYQSTLTLAGTVASTTTQTGTLVVGGGVGVGGNVNISGNLVLNTSTSAIIQSETGATVNTTAVTVDSWSSSTYRSAKYVVSVSNAGSNAWQTTEILVVHGAGNAYMQNTSVFTGNAPIMNFDTDISGGNVRLQATGTASGNTVKVHRLYLVV